jgi:hypothetical protein
MLYGKVTSAARTSSGDLTRFMEFKLLGASDTSRISNLKNKKFFNLGALCASFIPALYE